MLAKFVVILEQAGANLLPRFTPHPAEPECQDEELESAAGPLRGARRGAHRARRHARRRCLSDHGFS